MLPPHVPYWGFLHIPRRSIFQQYVRSMTRKAILYAFDVAMLLNRSSITACDMIEDARRSMCASQNPCFHAYNLSYRQ